MTDLDVHHEFDRLNTGISSHPDLAGLWAAGQRRRRRTCAIWVAAGLSTAAVVAPLALLVGGGATPAPSAPGFASGTAVTAEDVRLEGMQAAVLEAFPDAVGASFEPKPGEAAEDQWLYVDGMDGVRLAVGSASAGYRTECDASCPRVGDRTIAVLQGGPIKTDGLDEYHISVQVYPTDASRTEKVEVTALVNATTQAEAEAKLPSVETLTELALDERLVPPTE